MFPNVEQLHNLLFAVLNRAFYPLMWGALLALCLSMTLFFLFSATGILRLIVVTFRRGTANRSEHYLEVIALLFAAFVCLTFTVLTRVLSEYLYDFGIVNAWIPLH